MVMVDLLDRWVSLCSWLQQQDDSCWLVSSDDWALLCTDNALAGGVLTGKCAPPPPPEPHAVWSSRRDNIEFGEYSYALICALRLLQT